LLRRLVESGFRPGFHRPAFQLFVQRSSTVESNELRLGHHVVIVKEQEQRAPVAPFEFTTNPTLRACTTTIRARRAFPTSRPAPAPAVNPETHTPGDSVTSCVSCSPLWNEPDLLGSDDLSVLWLPVGTRYREHSDAAREQDGQRENCQCLREDFFEVFSDFMICASNRRACNFIRPHLFVRCLAGNSPPMNVIYALGVVCHSRRHGPNSCPQRFPSNSGLRLSIKPAKNPG